MEKILALLVVIFYSISLIFGQAYQELPHCTEKLSAGNVIVSTLDGKLSVLDKSGNLVWDIPTGPGPLLVSHIHNLELTNSGEYIRIIPSLSGTLYKFDGKTIDPIPINAENLLKSSFRYAEDLVLAGGYEVRTYGVGFDSGKILYECSPHKCEKDPRTEAEDVLLVERNTQIIRAVEPKTGNERWNFSVGLTKIKLSQVSCVDTGAVLDLNITAILPEGIVKSFGNGYNWQYKFPSPIVNVWKWDGKILSQINLFAPKSVNTNEISPVLYIGMHKKQLYIHESVVMQNILQGKDDTDIMVVNSREVAKIPWEPVPALDYDTQANLTAISVLNSSGYVDGNGYYLYTKEDFKKKNNVICDKNHSTEESLNLVEEQEYLIEYVVSWQMEILLLIITLIMINLMYIKYWSRIPTQEIIYVERPVALPTIERRVSERESEPETFQSRYENDFETLRCLGKGGFGVVFEVRAKIDECSYALKRITLPNDAKSKDRVMREVKALAKLEHQNIVRYFCSWVEKPPPGWRELHDESYIGEYSVTKSYKTKTTTEESSNYVSRKKALSISIDIPGYNNDESLSLDLAKSDDDSFIEFNTSNGPSDDKQSSVESSKNSSETICSTSTISTGIDTLSEHQLKKINWKKPGRKHHSWDSGCCNIPPPPTFLYIQMQLCKKESLKEWLMSNQDRNTDFSLSIFDQILDAVEYVHLRGLIHRDLKPSNIFFALDGQVKVGDFGLVKDMEDSLDDTKKTLCAMGGGHTVEVGTQLYMSPEQLQNGNYDYKVDIFSLGLVFFELLVPFSTDMERFKILSMLREGNYPNDFVQKFPNEYNILKEMLCKDPTKRLTTIGIHSKPPFEKQSQYNKEEYFYNLPSYVQKN